MRGGAPGGWGCGGVEGSRLGVATREVGRLCLMAKRAIE